MSALIHPSAIIEGDVVIGEGTSVGPWTVLRGPLFIGKNNKIGPHVTIGTDAEHRSKDSVGAIHIGDSNVICEFVSIHRGTGDLETRIEDRCFLMDYSHLSHDCLVQSDVTLAHHVVLAGHCKVLTGANLGISTVLHQFSTIGAYAMIGMGSVVTRDIPPFSLVKGNPARFSRWNAHALKKIGLNESALEIRNEALFSSDITVLTHLEEFRIHSRRKQLILR